MRDSWRGSPRLPACLVLHPLPWAQLVLWEGIQEQKVPKCESSTSRAVFDTWWGGETRAGRFMDSSLKCGPTSSWLKFLGKFLGFSKMHFLFQKRGLKSAFQSYVKLKCEFSSKVLKAALDSVREVRTQDVGGASLQECKF